MKRLSVWSKHIRTAVPLLQYSTFTWEGIDEFERFIHSLVRIKHPDMHPELQQRLADTVVLRRKRLRYVQLRQRKPQPLPQEAQAHKATVKSSPGELIVASALMRDSDRPSVVATTVTTLGEAFRPARSSFAPTVASMQIILPRHLPSPPSLLDGTRHSICPYCSQLLDRSFLQKPDKWRFVWLRHFFLGDMCLTLLRSHLVGDLQPWVCLHQGCDRPLQTFRTSFQWLQHMARHVMRWHCLAPCHAGRRHVFSTEHDFETHLRSEHSHTLNDSQLPWLLQTAKRPLLINMPECPFCRAFDGSNHDSDNDITHIGIHLVNIALVSLPDDGDGEGFKGTSSFSPSPDSTSFNAETLSDLAIDSEPGWLTETSHTGDDGSQALRDTVTAAREMGLSNGSEIPKYSDSGKGMIEWWLDILQPPSPEK